MAKRRRKPPPSQAHGRELWERHQADIALRDSPPMRELAERIRQLQESPVMRELQEKIRQARLRPPAPWTNPESKPPKRRKGGGGRKAKLTDDEIARLRGAYHDAVQKSEKQAAIFDELRKLVGRFVSDTTLRRLVVAPSRQNKSSGNFGAPK